MCDEGSLHEDLGDGSGSHEPTALRGCVDISSRGQRSLVVSLQCGSVHHVSVCSAVLEMAVPPPSSCLSPGAAIHGE